MNNVDVHAMTVYALSPCADVCSSAAGDTERHGSLAGCEMFLY